MSHHLLLVQHHVVDEARPFHEHVVELAGNRPGVVVIVQLRIRHRTRHEALHIEDQIVVGGDAGLYVAFTLTEWDVASVTLSGIGEQLRIPWSRAVELRLNPRPLDRPRLIRVHVAVGHGIDHERTRHPLFGSLAGFRVYGRQHCGFR